MVSRPLLYVGIRSLWLSQSALLEGPRSDKPAESEDSNETVASQEREENNKKQSLQCKNYDRIKEKIKGGNGYEI